MSLLVHVEHVSKSYSHSKALDDVNFDVSKGSSIALLGSNGAGKTTLLRCMVGLLRFKGKILFDGLDVARNGPEVRRRIAYLPQVTSFFPGTSVLDTLKFFVDAKGVSQGRIQPSLEFAGLENLGEKDVNSLSTGMKQRLVLSIALLSDPEVFYFDEPTSNLDVRAQIEFKTLMSTLLEQGKTIIIATHILGGVERITDRLLLLDRGRLLADSQMRTLLADHSILGHLFMRLKKEDEERAIRAISKIAPNEPTVKGDWLTVTCDPTDWQRILRSLDSDGIAVLEFKVEEPALEDVFLRLTGERIES